MSVTKKQMDRARKAIARKDVRCFDVCDSYGQIFGNVKHMHWFIVAVAETYQK